MSNDIEQLIQENWLRVRQLVDEAASQAGRRPEDVSVIGVTKYVDGSAARCLANAGCLDLGESRPQQLWDKSRELQELPIRWHLVGHLQRNKVKRTLETVHCIHSVDSLRLLQQIEIDASQLGVTAHLLLEVNVTGDSSKTGLPADQLSELASQSLQCTHLRIDGLMGMASLGSSPDQARSEFAAIRKLRDDLADDFGSSLSLNQLSMGMSTDFVEAILEGATLVRIGSALFEGIM